MKSGSKWFIMIRNNFANFSNLISVNLGAKFNFPKRKQKKKKIPSQPNPDNYQHADIAGRLSAHFSLHTGPLVEEWRPGFTKAQASNAVGVFFYMNAVAIEIS